jgi:hypothetical protein
MLIIKLTFIVFFCFILQVIYNYLNTHLSIFGETGIVMKTVVILMILNIVIMTGIVVFSAYQTEWRSIGRPGNQGRDGPTGITGDPICPDNPNGEYCRDDKEIYLK